MIVDPLELPARCDNCGCEIPFERIPEDDYRVLLDAHYFRFFKEELRMLEKVDDFRSRRGSKAADIVPHFQRVLDSDDPDVQRQLADGVAFDQIRLPPQPEPQLMHPEDQEVIDYLKSHTFDLDARFKFVRERLGELRKTSRTIPCPRCAKGSLQLVK